MNSDNPLLQSRLLPNYSSVRTEHLEPAVAHILDQNREAITAIIASQSQTPSWKGLVLAMENLEARLNEIIEVIATLGQVPRDDLWRESVSRCAGDIEAYQAQVLQNHDLFLLYQALSNSEAAASFDKAQQYLLTEKLRQFRLAGNELSPTNKIELTRLNRQISSLQWTFLTNARQASKRWTKHITDETELAGLPIETKARLANRAREAGLTGWLITLEEQALYGAIMAACENRPLREELFIANNTRASDHGPTNGPHDNGPVLAELLMLRHQKALLLGYENHAQLSLQNKMATSTDQVLSFLSHRIEQKKEHFAVQTAALHDLAVAMQYPSVQPWDVLFLAQKLGEQQSSISNSELSAYFPFQRMLGGLIVVVKRLFGVDLVEQHSFDTWHPDVRMFEVRDAGELLGHFFIDPFMRAPKTNGCWMQSARNRRITDEGVLVTPIAIFHGNFPPEAEGAPSLLSHIQMSMLFHEVGHCLKQLLTRSPYGSLSGVDSTGRDSAEVLGKCAEQWCWSKETLLWLARHFETDSRLSVEQVDQVLAARKAQFWPGEALELTYALFDFELHRTYGDGRSVYEVLLRSQKAVHPLPFIENDGFANTFDYMVTGYDAGYFGYVWAEALAEQVFVKFEQNSVFNPQTGLAYREAFYAPGAECAVLESFEIFTSHSANGFK